LYPNIQLNDILRLQYKLSVNVNISPIESNLMDYWEAIFMYEEYQNEKQKNTQTPGMIDLKSLLI